MVVVFGLFGRLFGGGFLAGSGRFRLKLHEVVGGRRRAGNIAEGGLELALVLVVDEGRGGFLQEVETGFVLGGRWGRRNMGGLLAVVVRC